MLFNGRIIITFKSFPTECRNSQVFAHSELHNEKNSHTVISDLFSRLNARLVTFLHLKTKFHRSYVLTFTVVAAMLPIMAKLSVILKSECANTWEFLQSLGKELKMMMILPLKNIFYSAITRLILKISQFFQQTMTLKSR